MATNLLEQDIKDSQSKLMEKFPECIKVSSDIDNILNKEYYTFVVNKLREEVYISILKKDMYYSLDSFQYYDHQKIKEMTELIMDELNKLGWKTLLAYGNTALFVYHGDKPANIPF